MRGVGIYRHEQTLAFVWLLYRIPYPGIGRDEWSATTTYNKGDAAIDARIPILCSVR